MDKVRGFAHSVFSGGHGWTRELGCVTKTGFRLPAELSGSISYINDQRVLVAIIRDVSERETAQHELIESEAKYRDIFHSAFDVNFLVDITRRILDINRRGEELTGYSRAELLRFSILEDLVVAEDRSAVENVIRRLIEGEEILFEVRWRTKRGGIVHFEGASTARLDPNGNFNSTRYTLRDITDRKQAEERAQQQLRRLAAVRDIDQAITSTLDVHVSLNVLLDKVTSQLGVDAADVLLFREHAKILEYAVGRNFRTDALRHTSLRLGGRWRRHPHLRR